MTTTQTIKKWGNTAAVRLPKKIVEAAHVSLDQELEVTVQGKSIVLTPIKKKNIKTLEQLLRGVTPDAVRGELDWGSEVGNERIA